MVVVGPGNVRFSPNEQVAILTRRLERIRVLLSEASGPVLIRITQSDIAERSLDELISEFEAGQR